MKSIEAKVVVLGSQGKRLKTFYCVCCIVVVWFGSLRPSQRFFNHVGTYCPGLNQYLADDKVSFWLMGRKLFPHHFNYV